MTTALQDRMGIMCGCGCEMALVLAGCNQPSREQQGDVERPSHADSEAAIKPAVGCWESLKLALQRVAHERAAAMQGRLPAEPT